MHNPTLSKSDSNFHHSKKLFSQQCTELHIGENITEKKKKII